MLHSCTDMASLGVKGMIRKDRVLAVLVGVLYRVYVERSNTLSLRLYITRIDESDAGLYTCTATVAPAGSSSRQRRMLTLSQQTRLFLYGQLQHSL